MNVLKKLNNIVSNAFETAGYDASLGVVTVSDRLDLCQFQCNGSFAAAKAAKKAPFIIADEVAQIVKGNSIILKAEGVKPGFINITLTDDYILGVLNQIANDKNLGVFQIDEPKTIILDYGGPNVAKPLHIGHLRSAIIGESLKRIARMSGFKVIGDTHLGDWGLPMGLVIAELQERNSDWVCFSQDFDIDTDTVPEIDVNILNEVYPYASQKSKENEEFLDKARQITLELQQGQSGYTALWQEIMRVSKADMKAIYDRLDVTFDLWYGESNAEPYVEPMIKILENKKILRESQGALVVDVSLPEDKAEVPPVIIKKSDSSNIYATTDLATILHRQTEYSPEKMWYVVDKRQSLHFTQVFRCAKKAEIVPQQTELEHLGFGTMNGTDGKPYKTRDGGVMQLSDLLDTVTQAAKNNISQSQYAQAGNQEEIANRLAIAAIKFGDLINHRSKDYIFDIDKFLSSEGKTGTYLLYTISRINSILNRAGIDYNQEVEFDFKNLYTDIEREIYIAIMLTTLAFESAISEKAPNYVCENAYKLASLFSVFYHENQIMNEKDENKKQTWLNLCLLVRKMLIMHFDALGIKPVESM